MQVTVFANISLEASAETESIKIFSGRRPREGVKLPQSVPGKLYNFHTLTHCLSVPETLENFHTSTRLSVREDFIAFATISCFKIRL